MAVLKYRLKGATLFEALTAMVIVLICFSIATMILVNLMRTDNGRMKVHLQLQLRSLYVESLQKKAFVDAHWEEEAYSIDKTVTAYKGSPNLYTISFIAFDKNKQVLATYKRIIAIEKQ